MKGIYLLKYQSALLVTCLAVFTATWATPETAHAQTPTPTSYLFASVNGFGQPGGGAIFEYATPYTPATRSVFFGNYKIGGSVVGSATFGLQ